MASGHEASSSKLQSIDVERSQEHSGIDLTHDYESINQFYQHIWDDEMERIMPKQRGWYEEVSVLLISWDPESDDLNSEAEVCRLNDVFVQKYNYHVTKVLLSQSSAKRPQVQVNLALAQFIHDQDDEDTLLIIYYSGHGSLGAGPGQLELSGTRGPSEDDNWDKVVWQTAEIILSDTAADILEIFDCCYAGDLGRGRPVWARRRFDFLCAASSGCWTMSPGESSFTSALIWALEDFAPQKTRFTTTDLVRKIKAAPHFPKDQVPVLMTRTVGYVDQIVLGPLTSTIVPIAPRAHAKAPMDKAFLDVKFVLKRLPSNSEIERLAKNLKFQLRERGLEVERVVWGGLVSWARLEGTKSAPLLNDNELLLTLTFVFDGHPNPAAITKLAESISPSVNLGALFVDRVIWGGLYSLAGDRALRKPLDVPNEIPLMALEAVKRFLELRRRNDPSNARLRHMKVQALVHEAVRRFRYGIQQRDKHSSMTLVNSPTPGSALGSSSANEIVPETAQLKVVELSITPEGTSDWDANSIASLESGASSIFSEAQGSSSSHSSAQGLSETARQQLLSIFIHDAELTNLYSEVLRKVSAERFIRNFRRLVRQFCADLQAKAQRQGEVEVVRMLRKQATWLANQICNLFCIPDPFRNLDSIIRQTPDKLRQLDLFLAQNQFSALNDSAVNAGDDHENNTSTESDSSEDNLLDFPNITQLQTFLTDGDAFQNFKDSLHNFVYPKRPKKSQFMEGNDALKKYRKYISQTVLSGCERLSDILNFCTAMRVCYVSSIANACTTLSMPTLGAMVRSFGQPPIAEGHWRLTWRCGCGDPLYTDVLEIEPGAAHELMQDLSGINERMKNTILNPSPKNSFANSTVNGSSSGLQSSQQAQAQGASTDVGALPASTLPNAGPSRITPFASNSLEASSISRYQHPKDRSFLMLCVNTSKHLVKLEQVEVSTTRNDQLLFFQIRQAYDRLRACRTGRFSLFMPVSVNIIKFELVPTRLEPCVGVLESSFPPPEEVRVQRYHYTPCPLNLEPPFAVNMFLHAFFDPREHTFHFWLDRLPKKLKERLLYTHASPGSDTPPRVGWGVHIIEGVNWLTITTALVSMLLFTCVFSVAWSAFRHGNVQEGFTLGQYFLALETAILSALFFKWTSPHQ